MSKNFFNNVLKQETCNTNPTLVLLTSTHLIHKVPTTPNISIFLETYVRFNKHINDEFDTSPVLITSQ